MLMLTLQGSASVSVSQLRTLRLTERRSLHEHRKHSGTSVQCGPDSVHADWDAADELTGGPTEAGAGTKL